MAKAMRRVRAARTALLTTGGLGALTASAWTGLGMWAGLAAGGLSCLLLEALTGPGEGEVRR